MRIVAPREEELVSEGAHPAVISAAPRKRTRKGRLSFLTLSVTEGKDKGREVDYLPPQGIVIGSSFHRFLASVLGALEIGQDIDSKQLVGQSCSIRVKHVRRRGRKFANVDAILPPETEHKGRDRRGR